MDELSKAKKLSDLVFELSRRDKIKDVSFITKYIADIVSLYGGKLDDGIMCFEKTLEGKLK